MIDIQAIKDRQSEIQSEIICLAITAHLKRSDWTKKEVLPRLTKRKYPALGTIHILMDGVVITEIRESDMVYTEQGLIS